MDLQQKLARAFLISFALLMGLGTHYFQHNQGGSGLELAVNNVVWIFFSILIGLGLWKITAQQTIFYSKYTAIIFIALGLFCLPIFYPNNILADQSYTRLLGLFAGILLFLSLQQFSFTRQQVNKLLLLIVLAGFIQACYSLMQDYLLPANNIFGYNVGYGRPYGIFQQPNVLASLMATTLILSGYLLQIINNKKLQVFLLLTAMLNIWVITIAMSRTGYLGSAIALILLLPWAWQTNKKRFSLFVVAILLGLGFASMKGDALGARNVDSLAEGGQRLVYYSNSWDMVKENPLLGYGYGSFEKEYLFHTAERVANGESKPEVSVLTHPHNDLLFWAVEGGIAPILGMLLLVFAFLFLLRSFKLNKALALLALVTPIALHTQTEYPLYHSALHWFVLMVLVFYVDYESETVNQKHFAPTFFLRVAGVLIPLFTAIFMLTNLYTIAKVTEYERSKDRDIRVLMDIVNPLVFDNNFAFHLYNFRLTLAIQTKNTEAIEKIIVELEKTIERTPKPYFLHLLYIAYKFDKQAEKAAQTLDYARYLYPGDKGLKNADKKPAATSDASSIGIETKVLTTNSAAVMSSTAEEQ
ncbi:O-antigen polymerase [Psychromonas sp. RZ22]|uniref:PglL family O-oligosaccharyltransferase n=1 Tax=Psychromonas algarum TaxID=2555643 RepID=UPI0010681336|nr:PglL family O-oligosaccharyltransferase [Psychromonas sp. RZ22]TEW53359.1 O-antigen polymerase [Psychromonas sp. RZ22]